MSSRARLSASVDAELLAAAARAVKRAPGRTLSAWVNDALRLKLEHDARLRALDAAIGEFEREHGAITDAEIAVAKRAVRARAIVIGGRKRRGG
jgi:hypothetical protein